MTTERTQYATGIAAGLTAVLIWALYLSCCCLGIEQGMEPAQFVFLRFFIAGSVFLPWLLKRGVRDLGGVGWWRGAALALVAGPIFIIAATVGFRYAPLTHGAVLQPSTAALSSIIVATLFLGEPLTRSRLIGTAIIIGGIMLIASQQGGGSGGSNVLLGDALFVGAGLCWMLFTVFMRVWSIDGLSATAAVSLWSALVSLPALIIIGVPGQLADLPADMLIAQTLVQGFGAGVIALIAYGMAVNRLGAGGAALFPALVPAATLVVGIPVTGHDPSALEWLGAVLASTGLAVAVGVFSATRHSASA